MGADLGVKVEEAGGVDEGFDDLAVRGLGHKGNGLVSQVLSVPLCKTQAFTFGM